MIRKATLDDISEIARIHVETWKKAYSGIIVQEYLDALSIERRKESWKKILNGNTETYVAVCEDGLAGWINFAPSRDEDGDGVYEIYGLYVQPKSWGKGIGKRLMEKAENILLSEYNHLGDVTLWVLEENHSSRAFYRKVGYEPDGIKKEDEIAGKLLVEVRMRKKLVLLDNA